MRGLLRWPMHGRSLLREPLYVGIACSIALHACVMALRFTPPSPLKFTPNDSQIEIVLLNAGTRQRPAKAEVLAQVDMSGGGDRDQGRARSPLPAEAKVSNGDALHRSERRVTELEEQQRRMLALSRDTPSTVAPDRRAQPVPTPSARGDADEQADQVIARLQAQIDRQISDYNQRPRRLTFGINAQGVSYAQYVDAWAERIERLGTEHYPPSARGRLYDSLICTVEIDRNGQVVDIIINQRSRHEVLNKAVRQIVRAGAPYPKFTPEMAKDGDILQIVRTWTFTNEGLSTEAIGVGRR